MWIICNTCGKGQEFIPSEENTWSIEGHECIDCGGSDPLTTFSFPKVVK